MAARRKICRKICPQVSRCTPRSAIIFTWASTCWPHFTVRVPSFCPWLTGAVTPSTSLTSVVTLPRMDFNKTDVERSHLSYAFLVDGREVSAGSALFTAPKHYLFADPGLTCEISGDEITVRAENYARFVEIDSPDSDFILSDNYFDMDGGSRTVKILQGTPKTIRLRSVYDIR